MVRGRDAHESTVILKQKLLKRRAHVFSAPITLKNFDMIPNLLLFEPDGGDTMGGSLRLVSKRLGPSKARGAITPHIEVASVAHSSDACSAKQIPRNSVK
jgi:hypothetical protein